MSKRGVIITTSFNSSPDGRGMWMKGAPIDLTELRQYLLYFDKIDWPQNNLIDHGIEGGDLELLLRDKILQRTPIYLSSFSTTNYGADRLKSRLQVEAFFKNNQNKNEEWVIAQPTNKIILPDDLSVEQQTVEIELYKCLPSLKPETKIEEILEFKEKRQEELKRLRSVLDDLYLEILSSKDIPRSKNRAIKKVEEALSDLEKVMKERGLKHFLSSFDVKLNVKDLTVGALAGFGAGVNFGLPAVGSAFGALFSSINFSVDLLKRPKNIPINLKAYAYLNDVKKNL